jgi:DNA polymerase I-like protein with 3'-5' exonuclease and polymerase domains
MVYFITGQTRIFNDGLIRTASIENCLTYFKNHKEIEVDTETEGYDPYTCKLLCIQLGDAKHQFVVDCATIDITILKDLLETKVLLIQNAQFDLRFLYRYNIFPKYIFDTLLMECILTTGLGDKGDIKDIKEDCGKKETAERYADRKVGLKDLAMKYLGKTISKDIRGQINREGLTDRVILYAAGDVDSLGLIKEAQLKEWEKFKLKYGASDELIKLENEVVLVFSIMLFNGITVNKDKYQKEVICRVNAMLEEDNETLNTLLYNSNIRKFKIYNAKKKKTKYFEIAFGGDLFNPYTYNNVNWSSPEQKLGILKSLDPTLPSTMYAEINKRTEIHPIFKTLINYNKHKKLQDSLGEGMLDLINPVTGKLHASIWQILSTGRISMSDPNLLQIPSKGDLAKIIRSCFIPRNEDYVIVGGDYSAFELRIIAEFSQDPLWLKVFREGGDLHSVLCAETFDIPIEDVKKPFYANPDVTYRDVQKTLDFGLSYGMSKFKLASTILVSVEEAENIINKFFSKVPKVQYFLDKLGEMAKRRGYIKSPAPYSRTRQFPKWNYLQQNPSSPKREKWLGEIERAGENSPIQSTNADIVKLTLVNLQKEIDRNNWDVFILLSIYDEVITEAHRSIAEEWRLTQNKIMIESAQQIIKTIPVVADCKISECWQK